MQTLAMRRFISNVRNGAFAQSAVQNTYAHAGNSIRKNIKIKDKTGYAEITAGETVIGSRCIVRKHKS